MLKNILKRDGTYKEFVSYKVNNAIKKAFENENTTYDPSVFFDVLKNIENKNTVSTKDIQELIEKELYKRKYFNVMHSFVLYSFLTKSYKF